MTEMIAVHYPSDTDQKPLAVIIEADQLTGWSLQSYLSHSFRTVICESLEEAQGYLEDQSLRAVLLGVELSPDQRQAVGQWVNRPDVNVVALVSDAEESWPKNVQIVEKPFTLERLAAILHLDEKRR